MTGLRAIWYAMARALDGLRRTPAVAAAVTGAVAVGFLLVGVVHLLAHNIEAMAQAWGGGAHMVVYLESGTPAADAEKLRAALASVPAVARSVHVSPAQALERLRRSLGDHQNLDDFNDVDDFDILVEDELGAAFLPASIEVTFAAGVEDVARSHSLVARVEAAVGVDEVVFVGDWADRLTLLMRTLRYGVWCFFGLMGAACVYVVATTMRLRAQAHRREAEVMELCGASAAFVRGPLLIEGMMQGALGAAVAMGALWLLFDTGASAVRETLRQALGSGQVAFLPVAHVAAFVAAGAVLGFLGSLLVTGRRYA
jgi:cell division transport system permease protein